MYMLTCLPCWLLMPMTGVLYLNWQVQPACPQVPLIPLQRLLAAFYIENASQIP